MIDAILIDTNVLVYRVDPCDQHKQAVATALLRNGLVDGTVVIPHQAIVEFVSAVTRPKAWLNGEPLLNQRDALQNAEDLMTQFRIVYPDADTLRTALRGCAAYQMSWFDSHMWAYAETLGIRELVSEDFEHGRHYGRVRVRNPFLPDQVQELPALYSS